MALTSTTLQVASLGLALALIVSCSDDLGSSGQASSPNFKARVRIGGPAPAGVAVGSEKKLTGSTEKSP